MYENLDQLLDAFDDDAQAVETMAVVDAQNTMMLLAFNEHGDLFYTRVPTEDDSPTGFIRDTEVHWPLRILHPATPEPSPSPGPLGGARRDTEAIARIDAEADNRYPELPIARENDDRAALFTEGALWALEAFAAEPSTAEHEWMVVSTVASGPTQGRTITSGPLDEETARWLITNDAEHFTRALHRRVAAGPWEPVHTSGNADV